MSREVGRLVLVWAALLGLLALTVGAAFLPLGPVKPVKPVIAYGIAAAKAGLVLWFFMELRREGPLARLAALAAFAWISILFLMVATDILSRGWVAVEVGNPPGFSGKAAVP